MFLSLIEKRRSIRKYQDRPVPSEWIDQLIEAALRSPSSRSLNPWEFIVVTDRARLRKLSMCKPHGASFLNEAPLGIVVCADTTRTDVWVEDASIAAIFIHLAASSLGLGSCWIQVRKRQYDAEKTSDRFIAEELGLPDHVAVEAILAVGYPAEEKRPHDFQSLPFEKIYFDQYGRKKAEGES